MAQRNLYCSFCGHLFETNALWPRKCAECGNTSYISPLPVAVTVLPVQTADSIGVLCVRRTIEPRLGQLALPGGFIEIGESWQAACVRELREEAGIEIDASQITLFDVHSAPDGTLLVFGLAPIIQENVLAVFLPTAEASECVVISEPIEIAFPLHTRVLARYLTD